MKRVFNFAMPFLQASLVKQILVGLVLGIALAYAAPAAAVSCGFLGTGFVTALKAVAPILVFVLVMSSIANQNLSGENLHIKPIIVLYLIGTFSAAIVAVVASFMFPTQLILTATDAVATTPGGIGEVLGNVILNVVDNPVHAISSGNYIGILAWAIAMGVVLRHGTVATREVLNDAAKGVEFVVRLVIPSASSASLRTPSPRPAPKSSSATSSFSWCFSAPCSSWLLSSIRSSSGSAPTRIRSP